VLSLAEDLPQGLLQLFGVLLGGRKNKSSTACAEGAFAEAGIKPSPRWVFENLARRSSGLRHAERVEHDVGIAGPSSGNGMVPTGTSGNHAPVCP